jgi:hypothetical protein
VTPRNPMGNADSLGKSFKTPKLEIEAKPIQIVVKLSEKSFTSPLLGAEGDRCDICINLFYNGEFNTSQVIEYSAWATHENKNCFDFGGRRVGTAHELPWVITTRSKDAYSTKGQISKIIMTLTPLERWNKLTEMLILEANEWGRDERGYRCPTGKYLESLSRKAIPSELDGSLVSIGSGFGVIDVVITFGRILHLDAAKEISSPRRNLHASQPAAAQVENKVATPLLARAIELPKGPSDSRLLDGLRSVAIETEHKDTPESSSTTEMSQAITTSSHQGDQINSDVVRVTEMAGFISQSSGSQAIMRRAASMNTCIPAAVVIAPSPRPPHPYRPENVPQKTYRGSEPVPPPSSLSKRQKTANLFEELPFDLNTATFMSTRARRSASMPFAQIPPKPPAESSLKRKRSANQAKSTLFNAESLETSTVGIPLTPKEDKVKNLKTTESSGPLKKKPRSSNFNAKLSNRPQNLRRKNSAGEWIIPPCRRNSAGEWETPTKGGQVKAGSYFGGHSNGAVMEASGKMFQPVFTGSAENSSCNMEIGPDTADQISPNGDAVTLKENIYPSNSAEKANRLPPTVAAAENKKENIPLSNSTGQSNEATIPVTPKIMSSLPEVIFRGVKSPHSPVIGSPNRDLLATCPPAAGALAFESYFRRGKKDDTIAANKNTPRKRTLHMRFFEGNVDSDGEIVGEGCGSMRWLVRRCVTPEYIPAPGSGKKPAPYPLFEKPKLKISGFAMGPKGETVTDVSIDPATARSRRTSGTRNTAGPGAASNQVIATLRDSKVELAQTPQLPAITQPLPRFVVASHSSKVLKLVKRQQVTTETNIIKQKAQGRTGQAAGYNTVDDSVGSNTSNHFGRMNACNSSVLATKNSPQQRSKQDTEFEPSSTPQAIEDKHIALSNRSTMVLAQKKDTTQDSDLEPQLVQGEASTQMLAGKTISKRPIRPRTVGSTELKALLESHDRHKIVNTSAGSPLEMVHSQPMTRASTKAISFKPRKVMGSSGVATDKIVPSDKPIIKLPVTSSTSSRKRSSSGQFVEKTTITTVISKHMKDMDGDSSKVDHAQTSSQINSGASSFEVKKPSLRTYRSGTPNPTVMATMASDLSLLGFGEFPPSDIPIAQTVKVVSKPQEVLESPKVTMQDFEGKPTKPTDKVETSVDRLNGAPIENPTSRRHASKDTSLQNDASDAMNFEAAAEELDGALEQVCKAKTEINKAVGDLESLTVRASAQRTVQKAAVVNTGRAKTSNAKTAEVSATEVHRSQEQNTPTLPVRAHGVNPWKPSCLCDESILTYAKSEDWDGLERNAVTGQMCKRVGAQGEGYFEAFGVLMGVRYVVVGSEVVKEW